MKIAVITDLHYAKEKNLACPDRMGERAKELLSAAVKRLNEETKPDILLVGGDLVNDSNDTELLKELAEIFQTVHCPQIIIPGNHDPEPALFYQYFQVLKMNQNHLYTFVVKPVFRMIETVNVQTNLLQIN